MSAGTERDGLCVACASTKNFPLPKRTKKEQENPHQLAQSTHHQRREKQGSPTVTAPQSAGLRPCAPAQQPSAAGCPSSLLPSLPTWPGAHNPVKQTFKRTDQCSPHPKPSGCNPAIISTPPTALRILTLSSFTIHASPLAT